MTAISVAIIPPSTTMTITMVTEAITPITMISVTPLMEAISLVRTSFGRRTNSQCASDQAYSCDNRADFHGGLLKREMRFNQTNRHEPLFRA